MFNLMRNQKLVNLGTGLTKFALDIGLPVKGIIRSTIFAHFCGGETMEGCKKVVNRLKEYNVYSILDYGVEAKSNEDELEKTAQYLVKSIKYAKEEPHFNIVVSKVTGLIRFELLHKMSQDKILTIPEQEEYDRGVQRVKYICKAAYDSNIQLYFDAEESWIQNAIDEIVTQMMEKYNQEAPIVFNTIQLYRHDRLAFLKNSFKEAETYNYFLAVKLVRGAYMEKERERARQMNYEDPIQPSKEATDKDFNSALKFCMKNIDKIAICCATHNEESTKLLADLINKSSMQNDHPHIEFSQLYGMSDHLTFNLAKSGYRAAKYIPYGPVKEVIPYLIRRAQENSSVDGQIGRELGLLKKEMENRSLISKASASQ